MPNTEIAWMFGIGVSTLYRWRQGTQQVRADTIPILVHLAERAIARGAAPAVVRRLSGLRTRPTDGATVRHVGRDEQQRLSAWSYLAAAAFDQDNLRQMDFKNAP